MTKIEVISKEVIQDYSDEMLSDIWLINHKKDSINIQNINANISDIDEILSVENSAICVFSSSFENLDSNLRDILFNATKNNKVYMLSNEFCDILNDFIGASLIRTKVALNGSFILVKNDDKEIDGIFFSNSLNDLEKCINFRLDSNQCKEFFNFFCYLFWEEAKQEYLDSKEPVDIVENNQDDCLMPYQNSLDSNYVKTYLSQYNDKVIKGIESIQDNSNVLTNNETNCNIIISNFRDNNKEMLLKLASNNKIFAVENLGFDMCLNANGKTFIIPRDSNKNCDVYALELNKDQMDKLNNFIKNTPCNLTFLSTETKGKLLDKEFYFLDSINTINSVRELAIHNDNIACDEVLDYESFNDLSLDYDSIKTKYNLYCQVQYNYTITPFYTPKDSKQAELYTQWKNTNARLQEMIKKQKDMIEQNRQKEKQLNTFTALLKDAKNIFARFFRGKEVTFENIESNLDSISQKADTECKNNTLTQEIFKELTDELNKCIENISKDNKEIDSKLQEAQARNEWEKKKDELEKNIESKKQDIEKLKDDIQNLKDKKDITEKEASKLDDTKNQKNEVSQKIKELYNLKNQKEKLEKENKNMGNLQEKVSNLEKQKQEQTQQEELDKIDQKLKDIKKQEEKLNENIKSIKDIESKLQDLDNLRAQKERLESTIKDLESKKDSIKTLDSRIKGSDEKLEKENSSLESMQNNLNKNYKDFKYKEQDTKSSLENVYNTESKKKNLDSKLNAPKEDLPKVGELREYKDRRYLEIQYYEQIESARKEAERLKAILSVKN